MERSTGRSLTVMTSLTPPSAAGVGLDLDVVDEAAVPELLDVLVELVLVERLAGLEAEVVEQRLLRERLVALELDVADRPAGSVRPVGAGLGGACGSPSAARSRRGWALRR